MSNKKVKPGWDKIWVHGGHPDSNYIGRKTGRENTKALEQIAPYLSRAFLSRKEKHATYTKGLMQQIIKLLTLKLTLLLKR